VGIAGKVLPREEEPQIKVPMIDVLVSMPGASAKEVEERVTRPMEKLLWEIPGSNTSTRLRSPGQSLVIVRFKVGREIERSLVKLNQKLQSNFDRIPHGVTFPLIKPKSIDDVPILALTFHSASYDHLTCGGWRRRWTTRQAGPAGGGDDADRRRAAPGAVLLDPARLASRNAESGRPGADAAAGQPPGPAGGLTTQQPRGADRNRRFPHDAEEVGNVVVGVFAGRPVYLRDVAEIVDGAEEPSQYVFFGRGADPGRRLEEQPAVTLTVAKRPGANAISVASEVLRKVEPSRAASFRPTSR
jgi:multidrug efflux pump subunit AcrB